jgi:hypothetical protein
MKRNPISVTLKSDNVAWLKARAVASRAGSVSALLDDIVTKARRAGVGPSQSVVGTIDVDPSDRHLDKADAAVRALFNASLAQPLVVREAPPTDTTWPSSKRRRGRTR